MKIPIKFWIQAFRLRTLPLALSSIFMGSFLAAGKEEFDIITASLTVLTTVLLQILSNLANDLGDSQNGADHQERKGPQRAVQSGAISMKAMKRAVYLFLILSFTSGISLLLWSLGLDFKTLTVFLGLGIASLAAAIFYTMGKRPYGYAGLGDISVLVFFGIIGVLGTYYLQIGTLTWPLILPALTCGLFSVGVLNLNNVRDIDSDKMAGKMSVPVRIGPANARVYHWFLLISGLLSAIVYGVFFFDNYLNWVFLVTVPLFLMNGWKLQKASNSTQIDPLLKQLALSTLLFVLLFGTFALI